MLVSRKESDEHYSALVGVFFLHAFASPPDTTPDVLEFVALEIFPSAGRIGISHLAIAD
jgi:hypothetical protein